MLTAFVFGFLFGAILRYAKLNRYNTISGMATLNDFTVAKTIALAIGVGAIIVGIEIGGGLANYYVKPFILVGVVLGGIIFGIGMAILGYCPGTMAISLGEGALDALFGIIGGLLAGLLFTLAHPFLKEILGPNLGPISLYTIFGKNPILFYVLLFLIGGFFIFASFWLHKIDIPRKDSKWIFSGTLLAVLNAVVWLKTVSNRHIGASSAYPYVADLLSGMTKNHYFETIQKSGKWEVAFLAGAILAGFLLSLIQKEFKFRLIHENWVEYKNNSTSSRIFWSLIGGFLVIFGARMAGGCTSGHVLSGGMQLALSSLVFAMFVFLSLLFTGRIFYGKENFYKRR